MAKEEDRARVIAERVARRVARRDAAPSKPSDRENGFGGSEVGRGNESRQPPETRRARVIDFVAAGPPLRTRSSIAQSPVPETPQSQVPSNTSEYFQFVPVAQSPWLGRLPAMLGQENPQPANLSAGSRAGQPGGGPSPQTVDHPSQERFGIEEATVAELVEFFEKEKKCSVDPSGKPCDHCAMCNSRGF